MFIISLIMFTFKIKKHGAKLTLKIFPTFLSSALFLFCFGVATLHDLPQMGNKIQCIRIFKKHQLPSVEQQFHATVDLRVCFSTLTAR